MKKLILLMLTLVVMLGVLAACATNTPTPTEIPEPTYQISAYKSKGAYTEPQNMLSWENTNKYPIKSTTMTTDEARTLVTDFFRYAKTVCWVPDDTLQFVRNSSGSADEMVKGIVHGGLPYVGLGSGNIYRLMDYMDPKTGVVNIKNAVESDKPYDGWKTFGNQCSIGAYWGFGRVINHANYKWTQGMTEKNGFYRIGPYTYDDNLARFGGKTNGVSNPTTTSLLEENGREVMYESYAMLKKGDGLTYYTTAGHVIMSSCDAVVVRGADGKIDPGQSYITIIDQGQTWIEDAKNEQGDTYKYKGGVDVKKTFVNLFDQHYVPWTLAEMNGWDPIEITESSFVTGDGKIYAKGTVSEEDRTFKSTTEAPKSITRDMLFTSYVTANYGISDIYAIVHDDNGSEVYKHAVRATSASIYKLTMIESTDKAVNNVERWGSLDDFTADEHLTVTIMAQLSTGERYTLWEGDLDLSEPA